MRKYDGLLDEWMDIDEQYRMNDLELKEIAQQVDVQEKEKQILKHEIEELEAKANGVAKELIDEKKINRIEDERNRKLS